MIKRKRNKRTARTLSVILKRLVSFVYKKEKGKFCDSCGATGRHVLDCKYQDWEGMKREMFNYYNAWLRRQKFIDGYCRQIVFWQGKYSILKQENNKLRKKLYKQN